MAEVAFEQRCFRAWRFASLCGRVYAHVHPYVVRLAENSESREEDVTKQCLAIFLHLITLVL